ncbi:hypothetical protein [Brevibacillus laterosporus]|uniref:Uncharacterized protein n=1 Tax=Brevibacillus laterosporus LMG 15441 TaxID=1042163 RepID=A0A075QYC8_BRELA|nr:hypothetical protein [Brevibacillus laterosporus]AIG25352.1 hypothetical protein BRLA_c010120 [Brevibacillus laterosporus LMG 15441]
MKKQTWNRTIFMVTVSLLTTSMITIGPEVTYASKGQASSIGAVLLRWLSLTGSI